MYRKATIWKVTLENVGGEPKTLHVMSPGGSFYELADLSKMLFEAAKEFDIDPDANILSIEKECVAFGSTKLPNEGMLALREDGTVVVNDPAKLALMAGLTPELGPLFEGTDKTRSRQDLADGRIDLRAVVGTPLASDVRVAQEITNAVEHGASVYERSIEADKRKAPGELSSIARRHLES